MKSIQIVLVIAKNNEEDMTDGDREILYDEINDMCEGHEWEAAGTYEIVEVDDDDDGLDA